MIWFAPFYSLISIAMGSIEMDPQVMQEWHLSPVRFLGGQHNLHWLVESGANALVLRRYSDRHSDLGYELEVLRRLRDLGWPVPQLIEQPIVSGGRTWCLFTQLPGAHTTKTGPAEQRARGRLLAELHESTASVTDLGQRRGFNRSDAVIRDPELLAAVRAYERVQPGPGHMMRWHIDRACERLETLDLDAAETLILHSDFSAWNILFEGDELSGVLDFEGTHLNFRVADFALSWRGRYDDVIKGYEEVHQLSDLDRQLLVPAFWSWLFMGVKEEFSSMLKGELAVHGSDWQIVHLARRSKLFGDLAEPYQK